MIRILLICLILGGSSAAFSQLKIVKDNIACTYGLKNEKGEWVVPATYVLIEELQHFYRITTAEGRGVMDKNGKVIVGPHYDAIDLMNSGFFRANVKSKYAILNSRGKALCQPLYHTVLDDLHGRIMLYKYDEYKYRTTCIDTAGNVMIPEVEGYIPAFGANNFALIGMYPGHDNSISGEAGVIDRSGKLMVPRNYDRLKYCESRLIFMKNYKTGVIDLSNNVLLEAKYTVITPDGSTPCFRENEVLKIMDGPKIGFMRGNGEILLEPSIDELIPLYNDQQSKKAFTLFRTNGKMGIISEDYKMTVVAMYDTIIPRNRISWNDPYNSQTKKKLCFQFMKNGKHGLMKEDGTIICEAVYDNFLRSDYAKKPAYFLSKGLDIYLLDYEQDSIIPEKAKLVSRYDTLLIFESRGELLPCFIREKPGQIAAMGSEHMEYRTNGPFFYVATRRGYSYFTTDGKVFMKNRIQYMDFSTGKYALLSTRSGKKGLYSMGRRKMIVDTLYDNINAAYSAFNQVWAQLPYKADKNADVYIWNPMDVNARQLPLSEWILLDTNGRRLSKDVFDGIVQQRDTTVAYSKGLSGLVDVNINWLVPPGYVKVLRIGKNQVAVYTKGGKYGLVNLQNKILVDTVYTDFREIYAGSYTDWKRFSSQGSFDPYHYQRWQLFRNENQQILINERGEILTSGKTSDAKKMEQILMDLAFRGVTNSNTSALRIALLPHQDSLFSGLVFRKELYKLLRSYHDTLHFCNPLEMVPNAYYRVQDQCYTNFFPFYSLKSLGKNYVTVESINPSRRSQWGEWGGDLYLQGNSYENRIWKNEKLEKITLGELFPDVEVLEGELIRALKDRDDLKLECASPANMLERIGEDFSLSAQGIILHYTENYYQAIEFLIPLERLKQNPQTKWIVDYLY